MKKVLIIIGAAVFGIFALAIVIIGIVSATSEKMKCESSRGSITLMYNDEKLTGYAANNMDYDFDGQKTYASRIGVNAYLNEFADWFEENTGGTCRR